MDNRTRRTDIFKILFQTEFQPETDIDELVELYLSQEDQDDDVRRERMSDEDIVAIKNKLSSIVERIAEIDDRIERESQGWSFNRIGKAELSILRLSVYEILYDEDASDAIIADEAVRLCKKFADDKASKFVNGILGTVIRDKDKSGE